MVPVGAEPQTAITVAAVRQTSVAETAITVAAIRQTSVAETPITVAAVRQTSVAETPITVAAVRQTSVAETPITVAAVRQTSVAEAPITVAAVRQTSVAETAITVAAVRRTTVSQTAVAYTTVGTTTPLRVGCNRHHNEDAPMTIAAVSTVRIFFISSIPSHQQHIQSGIAPVFVELCDADVAVNDVKRLSRFGQERGCLFPFRSERQVRPARREAACRLSVLRKPFLASCMAAAVQRNAIEDELHRFTLRVTRRTVPIMFSMMLCRPASAAVRWASRAGSP